MSSSSGLESGALKGMNLCAAFVPSYLRRKAPHASGHSLPSCQQVCLFVKHFLSTLCVPGSGPGTVAGLGKLLILRHGESAGSSGLSVQSCFKWALWFDL